MEKNRQNNIIVIVDDEPMVTSSLKNLLVLEGFVTPMVFNSPFEALEFIKKSKIDLVISDFLMPNMNGIEFLSEVKKLHPNVSMILLTGYADKENAIQAINKIGLYRYLEKPWDSEDLLLSIKTGIERSHLIENLEEKIKELSEAKLQLQNYSEQLESIVRERTLDLVKINSELSAIINHCADGIITVTKDGLICGGNPAFERMTGSSKVKDRSFCEIFENNTNKTLCSELNQDKDIFLRGYKIINSKTNRTMPVEISFAPIKSDTEEVNSYVGVIRDITAQLEMDRLREDFIATLTHDLRTPLLAAIQTLKFFLDGTLGDLSEKQQKFLETMFCSNQDMLGLVNALLEVYKYESGQLVLYKDYFNLKDFITQCTQEISSLLEKKNIQLNVYGIINEKIYADKQELRRVIANLLGNAINHTPQNGQIDIYSEDQGDFVTVTIEDNGIGIPEGDIPKLFKRFSQGTTKKRSSGTGLGLYLSRQIIEAHSGRIWLESELNKGSKFKFKIPKEVRE